MTSSVRIQTPRGIRFACSGCGNCCLQWPVPVTSEDIERIRKISSGAEPICRPLRSSRENLLGFSQTLEKREDGKCEFLSDENLCRLHSEKGEEAKPSMCRLFPYSFTVTPDAVLASLSFASTSVLENRGELLSASPGILEDRYNLFHSLFRPKTELWMNLQLLDGTALSWADFKKLDAEMGSIIEDEAAPADEPPAQMPAKLKRSAALLLTKLPDPKEAEKEPRLESRPKTVDQILLKHLELLYFPEQAYAGAYCDIDGRSMLAEMISAPETVSFGQGQSTRKFSELIKMKLGKLSPETEDLLNRFLYLRLFSKQFFGPGFHHLSLIAGLNHLRILHILLRLKIKQVLCSGESIKTDFALSCELIRTLERRLTVIEFSPQSQAMLEVMLSSPERQERISFLAE